MRFWSLLKRDAGAFGRGAVWALLLTALFFLLCFLAAAAFSTAEEGAQPVRLLVVDEDGSDLSRLAVRIARGQTFLSVSLEIRSAGREEAMAQLRRGECAAVLVLPQGYLQAILSGRDCEGELILSDALALHADVAGTLARAGEQMLAAGQMAVFSGEELILDRDLGREVHLRFLDEVNLALISGALNGYASAFAERDAGYADTGMGLLEHYALAWVTLLFTLSVFLFHRLLRQDLELWPRLRSSGTRSWEFLAGKLLFPALFRMLLLLSAAVAAGRWLGTGPLTARTLLWMLTAAALGSLWDGALLLWLGEGAVTGAALLAGCGLFLAGGIYPRRMLPTPLVLLGRFTPYGALRGLLSPLFGGRCGLLEAGMAAVYSAVALLLLRFALRRVLKGGEPA